MVPKVDFFSTFGTCIGTFWLISNGESLLVMSRFLQFVNHCDGIIFHGDMALAIGIYDEVVLAKTELACSFSRFQRTSRGEENPVDVMLVHQGVKLPMLIIDNVKLLIFFCDIVTSSVTNSVIVLSKMVTELFLFLIFNFIFPFTFCVILCDSLAYGERRMNVTVSSYFKK